MSNSPITLAIVGVGKIVRDQHLPSIYQNDAFDLIAAASRNGKVDGIDNFTNIEEMVAAVPELNSVALCMPPQYRYQAAHYALSHGLNVLLEKPPGATVSEVEGLVDLANEKKVSLFATWHSRFGAAVEASKAALSDLQIMSVNVVWKENVRRWHTGQQWIWEAGGLGVFDPGINALSILTHILPEPVFITESQLYIPENKAAPIAATLALSSPSNIPITVEFDWRQTHDEIWQIEIQTNAGLVLLGSSGSTLFIDGKPFEVEESSEYANIYTRFAELLNNKQSDVDLAPLQLAADAFMLGKQERVEAFYDDVESTVRTEVSG